MKINYLLRSLIFALGLLISEIKGTCYQSGVKSGVKSNDTYANHACTVDSDCADGRQCTGGLCNNCLN